MLPLVIVDQLEASITGKCIVHVQTYKILTNLNLERSASPMKLSVLSLKSKQ